MALRNRFHVAEAVLHCLDEHLAHRLTWQPLAFPGSLGHDLAVAVVFGEGGRYGLAGVAFDSQAIGAPPQVTARDRHTALMGACGLASAWCLG